MRVDDVEALQQACQDSVKNANKLAEIVGALRSEEREVAMAAMHAGRSVLQEWTHRGLLHQDGTAPPAAKRKQGEALQAKRALAQWLHLQKKTYIRTLTGWLHDTGDEEKVDGALRSLMAFIPLAVDNGSSESKGLKFDFALLRDIVAELVSDPEDGADPSQAVVDVLQEEFVEEFDDFRFHFMHAIRELAEGKLALRSSAHEQGAAEGEDEDNGKRGAGKRRLNGWRSLLASCPERTFSRRLAGLLLVISLPPSDEEWGEREYLCPASAVASSKERGDEEEEEEEEKEGRAENREVAGARKGGKKGASSRKRAREEQTPSAGSLPRVAQLRWQRHALEEAWMAVLRLELPPSARKQILVALPSDIIPFMNQPLRLADFLTETCRRARPSQSPPPLPSSPQAPSLPPAAAQRAAEEAVDVASGRAVEGLLGLRGLFLLMRQHGLEYPNFYPMLYSMLQPALLHVKHRPRFFRLLDLFLSSANLPAYVVAAFAKRLARLALSAPSGAILFIMPFVFNLIKRHPACTPLLHRGPSGAGLRGPKAMSAAVSATEGDGADRGPARGDPFDPHTDDMSSCRAIESSLWEVKALRSHAHPLVAARAAVFERDLSRPEFDLTRFLKEDYASLFQREMARSERAAAPQGSEAEEEEAGEVEAEGGLKVAPKKPKPKGKKVWRRRAKPVTPLDSTPLATYGPEALFDEPAVGRSKPKPLTAGEEAEADESGEVDEAAVEHAVQSGIRGKEVSKVAVEAIRTWERARHHAMASVEEAVPLNIIGDIFDLRQSHE